MRINQEYSVRQLDEYNVAIIRHRVRGDNSKNKGEEFETVLGYYGKWEKALCKLLEMHIDDENMQTILTSLQEAKKQIVEVLHEHGRA